MITLPDGRTTPGLVSRIGTVATGSDSSSSTIAVYIALRYPEAAGSLDHVTVQVQITTATVKHALAVPVTALVALADGQYAVNILDAHGRRQLVPITLGLLDDTEGLVQVTSHSLAAGQQVLVPGTSAT
jgi:hypothetical protein